MRAGLLAVMTSATVAMLPSFVAARDFQATTSAGRAVRVATQASWRQDCSPNSPPQIQVTQAPEHGKVSLSRSATTIQNADAGGEQCIGRRASGVGIVYTPQQGFRGVDQFAFTAAFPSGVVLNDQASVTVR